jgi:ssDNA-binding Zn-finger/Zn-ribbon topoisomerase 1
MNEHQHCKVITNQKDKYELEVVECNHCGFHLGIDASYLEQVDGVSLACPGCNITLVIPGEGEADGETTPFQRPHG